MSKVALFFEKMHKVFKNKAQRCSTPLKVKNPNSIVAVKRIDLTDWLDIMMDGLNHWSPRADFLM